MQVGDLVKLGANATGVRDEWDMVGIVTEWDQDGGWVQWAGNPDWDMEYQEDLEVISASR